MHAMGSSKRKEEMDEEEIEGPAKKRKTEETESASGGPATEPPTTESQNGMIDQWLYILTH